MPKLVRTLVVLAVGSLLFAGCASSQEGLSKAAEPPAAPAAPATPKRSEISVGNGEANWIITEGSSREGATFLFPEVQIDGNGWLVMHPFEDGKPNGDIYVGASYVSSGNNNNVEITLDHEPSSGDMYIVMLHRDVDEDQNFDFVFIGDTGQVEDKAVFEGTTMIGHPYPAP